MLAERIQTAIRITPELYEKLKKEAKEKGVTVNAYISMKLKEMSEQK